MILEGAYRDQRVRDETSEARANIKRFGLRKTSTPIAVVEVDGRLYGVEAKLSLLDRGTIVFVAPCRCVYRGCRHPDSQYTMWASDQVIMVKGEKVYHSCRQHMENAGEVLRAKL